MTALWILVSSFCSAAIIACIQSLGQTIALIDLAFVQFSFVLAVTVAVMLAKPASPPQQPTVEAKPSIGVSLPPSLPPSAASL